jgi:hypothetical protein
MRILFNSTSSQENGGAGVTELRYPALSERARAAIRAAHDGYGKARIDWPNNRLLFKDADGEFPLTHEQVSDYISAWRKSGAWTLHGAPPPLKGGRYQ